MYGDEPPYGSDIEDFEFDPEEYSFEPYTEAEKRDALRAENKR